MLLQVFHLYVCCSFFISSEKFVKNDFDPPVLLYDTSIRYSEKKNQINIERLKLAQMYQRKLLSLDSAGQLFTQYLVNEIMPYWYGTQWDFNGYTDLPKEGKIACGYLVSTTLKHAGINVNRYKMAQKSALEGAIMLEPKNQLIIEHTVRDSFLSHFKKDGKKGLYMLGLSNHVGYLYNTGDEIYFIHSSYLSPAAVNCEKASDSEALLYSGVFVLADISNNHQLMKKWLSGEVLPY